jgi:hypothetical protein
MEVLDGNDALERGAQCNCGGHGVHAQNSKFDELQRISILLNRTREEVARDHITRSES